MGNFVTLASRLSDGQKLAFKVSADRFYNELKSPRLLQEEFFIGLPEAQECLGQQVDYIAHMSSDCRGAAFAPRESGMVFIDFVDKHVWGFVEESVLGSSKNEVMSQYIDFAFDERLPDGSYPSFDQASKPYPALSLVLHAKEQGGWIFTEHDDVILLDGDANSVFSEIAGQDFLEMASLGHHTKDACKQMIDGADINFIVPPPEWMFSDLRNKSGFLQMARIQISNLGLLGDVDAQCFEERLDEILKEELTEKVRQHSACVDGKCLIRGKCH